MNQTKVLFICVHNSARSQMAEAFLNKYGGDKFIAESAGLEPGKLNPIVVDAMKEVGIDISANQTKGVFDFFKQGRRYHYVVTVCDEANAERCPIFPGSKRNNSLELQRSIGIDRKLRGKTQRNTDDQGRNRKKCTRVGRGII